MESVVSRLEAVAARLERIESSAKGISAAPAARPSASTRSASTNATNSRVAHPPAATSPGSGAPGQYDESAWTAFIGSEVEACATAVSALDKQFQGGTTHFVNGTRMMVDIIKLSRQRSKPSGDEFQGLLQPLCDAINSVESLTHGARTKATNHHKAIGECMNSFAWITYDATAGGPTPDAAIADGLGSAEMFINRVIMEFRDTAPEHKVWALAIKAMMKKLQALAKQQFPMGLTWTGPASKPDQAAGSPPQDAAKSSATAPASEPATSNPAAPPPGPGDTDKGSPQEAKAEPESSETGAPAKDKAPGVGGPAAPPPPPPPPPPGMLLEKLKAAGGGGGDTRSAILNAINRGSNVTSGLRKVTDDMKTKNQKDRSGVVKAPTAAKKSAAARGPARKELQQNRWQIENWVACDAVELQEDQVQRSHAVYISHCAECVVQVHGKVNTIMLDSCRKVGLVFGSVVSTVELVNCNSCKVQCNTACPTLNIDKTDGAQVYLSADAAAATEVVTSKSSSMSVTVLAADAEAEPTEHPVPEQFMSKIVDGKLVTVPVSHL